LLETDEEKFLKIASLPQEHKVLTAIRDFGLELNIIFNKGSVMVLPAGVNKGSGLAAALHKMRLSPHNAIGIGDAENDHAFLELWTEGLSPPSAFFCIRWAIAGSSRER